MRNDYLAKRAFDLVFASLGLVALSPMLFVIAAAVKLSDGGPVLFKQERVGLHGKTFRILKFRTMFVGAERTGRQITAAGDQRITRIGRFLRKAKFDELPQLWNVLRGQMSFVGPRPEVPRYVQMYSPEQRAILELLPGITDLASITFYREEEILAKSANPEQTYVHEVMPEKIRLNLEYASTGNLKSDFQLIVMTITRITRSRK